MSQTFTFELLYGVSPVVEILYLQKRFSTYCSALLVTVGHSSDNAHLKREVGNRGLNSGSMVLRSIHHVERLTGGH